MDRILLTAAGAAGFLGVALGAFGAHALKARLSAEMLAIYQTGVQYHLVHAAALLGVAVAATRWPGPLTTAAGWCFVAGIVVFSGSLYVLALTGITRLGMITPLGGLSFLAGWICLALVAWRG